MLFPLFHFQFERQFLRAVKRKKVRKQKVLGTPNISIEKNQDYSIL